jgi:hypothetical protein
MLRKSCRNGAEQSKELTETYKASFEINLSTYTRIKHLQLPLDDHPTTKYHEKDNQILNGARVRRLQ